MNLKDQTLRVLAMPSRLGTALSYVGKTLAKVVRWLFVSREHTNFTYHLTDLNRRYLARLLAVVCRCPYATMEQYMSEVLEDAVLRDHVMRLSRADVRGFLADDEPRYARRIGWYAVVRATRPRVIVETGVDKGLGSCILAAALMKNAADGFPGYLFGTDINPKAGYLLRPPYDQFGAVIYGDSIACLQGLEKVIDLFINDSDHSTEYEMHEYETVLPKLAPSAILIGDNSHVSDKLLNFAERTGREFLYFQEQPEDHWYPGGGIGIAYPRNTTGA